MDNGSAPGVSSRARRSHAPRRDQPSGFPREVRPLFHCRRAIRPEDGFRYAFRGGADFICAGMFDFQVAEDVAIAKAVLAGLSGRDRPWRG
jgi:hypothetical protein